VREEEEEEGEKAEEEVRKEGEKELSQNAKTSLDGSKTRSLTLSCIDD